MATQKEYIEAAIERIRDWCKVTDCEIPDVAYIAIYNELKTMFEHPSEIQQLSEQISKLTHICDKPNRLKRKARAQFCF